MFISSQHHNEGFKKLLARVLKEEINALPRGTGRRNLIAMKNQPQSMTSSIPDALRNLYEASTRPGILPGVAGQYSFSIIYSFIRSFASEKTSAVCVSKVTLRIYYLDNRQCISINGGA